MKTRALAQALTLLPLLYLTGSPVDPQVAAPPIAPDGIVRLPATASIWLADTTPEERNSSAGRVGGFKLKSIQEMAAIRFDARAAAGRQVLSARLFLHRSGADRLRYLRVSTVNQDWVAGTSRVPYGRASGATYLWADADTRRAWSYPGSEFADVVMGMGHSITTYGAREEHANGWVSVPLTPELVYALATDHTDGLAVMDGGTPAFFNNVIDGAGSGDRAPFIDVTLGGPLVEPPATPQVVAGAAPARAHMTTGAIKVALEPAPDVFFWDVEVDGQPVPRWQVPYPPAVAETGLEQERIRSGRTPPNGPVVFYLDRLKPQQTHTLNVKAVARGGAESPAVTITVQASAALAAPPSLELSDEPRGVATPATGGVAFSMWAVPGLIKIDPETGISMSGDIAGDGRGTSRNAVWDGEMIQLRGARGEYVSYQLVIERADGTRPLTEVTVVPGELSGANGVIGGADIELFKNWYARNSDNRWQPAYTIPWEPGRAISIPDRQRGIDGQMNQSMYVDVYIPKDARPGTYTGRVQVSAGSDAAMLPVQLRVYDFALPDRLSFWPELNAYQIPANALDFHRLAHQHRLVFNPWAVRPRLEGAGSNIRVQWDEYDRAVGPLLSGEAFARNRRAGVPTPVMYLPFIDSWPTPLSPETYRYDGHWPGRGEPSTSLIDHYMTAPYIGDGLSQSYRDAFFAVQKQFVEHFEQRGWNRTEMQLFFGGKNSHRIDYGINMWWTTDEPYHWDDWLALQFFGSLWAEGRRALGADRRVWSVRADLSRPMWAGRVLDTIVDHAYWGGFTDPRWHQRAAWLSEQTGLGIRVYGSVNPAKESHTQSVSALLQAWLHGANACLPWQTLGNEASLDVTDNVVGAALLVPGTRFGLPVVGDMRLKALRDGEQIIEYLVILSERYHLQREQVRAMLEDALRLSAGTASGASQDDAEAARFSMLEAWRIAELRRALAERIVGGG